MFEFISPLFVLFAAAFLAASMIPAQSEAVLAGLSLAGDHSAWLLLCIATAGNVLGSMVNWLLGRYLIHFKDRRWFPVKEPSLERATRAYQRFGLWTLLFAWVPLIGDPITMIAGCLRVPLFLFTLMVTIGKAARYTALLAVL